MRRKPGATSQARAMLKSIMCWSVGFALLGPAVALTARSQPAYPTRAVRIIVPLGAGTAPDVMARLYAEQLGRSLGQPFVVENKAGASGNIGAEAVAKAPADGYTLLYAYNQISTMNPHLFRLNYDPVRDLAPVSVTSSTAYVLLANNQFPAHDLSEALAYARSRPDTIAYGSYGPGTPGHLIFETIEEMTHTRFLHVPGKQGQVTDVMGGQIPMLVEPFPSGLPYVASGKVKALAVTSKKRVAALPDVPNLSEAVPGLDLLGWQGV